jgi:LmbE family N-acetylglucosaminyl deacetylase
MPDPETSFADSYIPDGAAPAEARARTSHLAIGAHQDDLEFMAFHGITSCYEQPMHWFSGVICTDGGGSARAGKYADYTDEQMKALRIEEQRAAADLGQYSFIDQLGLSSQIIKTEAGRTRLADQLEQILLTTQPEIVYTHNPADKHATHVAVCRATLEAINRIPPYSRPKQVYGCEVWRDLDWLCDDDKVALDVSAQPELAKKLHACFDSQIAGGKNYSEAVIGRSIANATFFQAHAVDAVEKLWFAMDLTPLTEIEAPTLEALVEEKIARFKQSTLDGLEHSA